MTHSYPISATQYQILTERQRQVDTAQAALNLACTLVLAQYDVTEAQPTSIERGPDGGYLLVVELPDPHPSPEVTP